MNATSRIARIEVQRVEDAPLARPMHIAWDPGTVRTTDSFTVVRVYDEDGRMGIGTGGRAKPLRSACSMLIGAGVFDVERHAEVLRQVGGAFGLDTAIWDLMGKIRGEPLAVLWGGRCDRVRAYVATVELGSPERRAEDAVGFAEEGFLGMKLRLHNPRIEDDIALAAAVREAIGDRLVLMADANQARAAQRDTEVRWSYDRAVDTARALEALGFAWLEEPRPIDAIDELANLRATVGIPIAGGERDASPAAFDRLLDGAAYDIFQPDGLVVGSVGSLREIAAMTAASGKQCVMHHGGGGIGAYAHLHLAAAICNAPWFEVLRDRPGEIPWPAQLAPDQPIAIDAQGDVLVPSAPGLGISPDEEFLDAHTATRTVYGV